MQYVLSWVSDEEPSITEKQVYGIVTTRFTDKFNIPINYIMEEAIPDKEQRQVFVERNSERKKINAIRRKVRLSKKANLQTWNFFCTFTYSDDKHTEESFRKSLRNTLKHFVNRKGWKHIGVWERGGDTNRLHFHGIFYIPPDGMVVYKVDIASVLRYKLNNSNT